MSKPEYYCNTCGFWQIGFPGMPQGMGLCRRNPPVMVLTQQGPQPAQPWTNGELDWCGEHEVAPQRVFVAPEPTPAEILLAGVQEATMADNLRAVQQVRPGFKP